MTITMKIDGQEVKSEHRSPLLKAIRSLGIEVPTLCHLDGLEPYGVCRMCIVEVKKGKRTRLVTSCNYPAEDGLEVSTNTARVRQHRRIMAELLLARCPDVVKVQELAEKLGVKKSRFKTIAPSDCVMCGLCVRVCDQIVGASALSFIGRGNQRVVGTPWSLDPDSCIACGACGFVCPTVAMKMAKQTIQRWRRELASDKRVCRYARMGLISYKICPNDFQCAGCEVDQALFEKMGTHPILAAQPGLLRIPKKVGLFDVLGDRFYSPGHTWVKPMHNKVHVGIDDFARKLIGPTEKLNLKAKPNDTVKSGDPAVSIENNGHQSTLYFPISGTVTQVNKALIDDPAMLEEDCYERGWLVAIKPDDFYAESCRLIQYDEVGSWIKEQSQELIEHLKTKGITELTPGALEKISNQEEFARLNEKFFKFDLASK